jgi:two-component sensor histidine kinase
MRARGLFHVLLVGTVLQPVHHCRASLPEDRQVGMPAADAPLAERCSAYMALAGQSLRLDPRMALRHSRKALELAESTGDARLELEALGWKAKAEQRCGLGTEHTRTALRAVEVAGTTNDPVVLSKALRGLAEAYLVEGLPHKAVEEARNATALVMPTRDRKVVQEARLFILDMMLEAGQLQELLREADRFLAQERQNGSDDGALDAQVHLRSAAALAAMAKPGDALPYLVQAERWITAEGGEAERLRLHRTHANVALDLGMAAQARKHLEQARTIAARTAEPATELALLAMDARLAKLEGRWKDAVERLEALRVLDDSVRNAHLGSQVAELHVMHETGRTEADNQRLRELERSNQATIASQRRDTMLLLGAVLLLALLVGVLFVMTKRNITIAARLRMKNEVVRRQRAELEERNLELQRERARMAEAMLNEEQRETLLKEIHHRVKNNLQVVDSLLGLRAHGTKDGVVHDIVREAQSRIRSMAQVHEHLYKSAGDPRSTLKTHLEQLARKVLVSYGAHDRLSILVECVEPGFGPDTLMPLSLMVNELITNSVKHAFANDEAGTLRIVLRTAGEGFELIYADSGCTAPGNGLEGGFGSELLKVIAHQLNGELRALKGRGMAVSLVFSPDKRLLRKAV